MKKILAIILALVVCFSVVACGESEKSGDVQKVESGELSFEVPADWVNDSDDKGLVYNTTDVSCGVLVSRDDLSDLPIEEIQSLAAESADKYIKNRKDGISDAKKENIKIDGTDAIRIDYKMSFDNGVKSDEIDIIAISKDNYVNNLTFYVNEGSESSKQLEVVEKIIESIRL